jgi:hypothetical protein
MWLPEICPWRMRAFFRPGLGGDSALNRIRYAIEQIIRKLITTEQVIG